MDKAEAKIRVLLRLAMKYKIAWSEGGYTCTICGWKEKDRAQYSFSSTIFMERHMRQHIKDGDITEENVALVSN